MGELEGCWRVAAIYVRELREAEKMPDISRYIEGVSCSVLYAFGFSS